MNFLLEIKNSILHFWFVKVILGIIVLFWFAVVIQKIFTKFKKPSNRGVADGVVSKADTANNLPTEDIPVFDEDEVI